VVAAAAAAYIAVGMAAWCWDGAYNLLQGDPPDRLFAATLAGAGLTPFVTAWFGFRVQRRSGQLWLTPTPGVDLHPLGTSRR
jgi:hypothetical protein